jgi:hypothetical protein
MRPGIVLVNLLPAVLVVGAFIFWQAHSNGPVPACGPHARRKHRAPTGTGAGERNAPQRFTQLWEHPSNGFKKNRRYGAREPRGARSIGPIYAVFLVGTTSCVVRAASSGTAISRRNIGSSFRPALRGRGHRSVMFLPKSKTMRGCAPVNLRP